MGGKVYKGDSLLFNIRNRTCHYLELAPGHYQFKSYFGSFLEGTKNHGITVEISKGHTTFVNMTLQLGKGNTMPTSGFILKMSEVTQPGSIQKMLSYRFVRKEISGALFQQFRKQSLKVATKK